MKSTNPKNNAVKELHNSAAKLHTTMMGWLNTTENLLMSDKAKQLSNPDIIKLMAVLDLARASLVLTHQITTKLSPVPEDSSELEDRLCDMCLKLAACRRYEREGEQQNVQPTTGPGGESGSTPA